jgi:thioredoxin 1
MSKAAATGTATFQQDVLQSDLPVLVDFWAEWCGPCKMIAPALDQLASELEGKLRIFKVDVDADPELASRFGIQGIPTLILFSGGQPRAQLVGARSKPDLLREIERAFGVTP